MASAHDGPLDAALLAILETADEAAIVYDEALCCRAAARRTGEILGVASRALVGRTRRELVAELAALATEPEALLAAIRDEALGNEATVVDPVELRAPLARTLVWTTVPLRRDGEVSGRLDLLRDVTRERRAEREVEAMRRKLDEVSPVDDLTGLANERRFLQDCEREHRRAQRAWEPYAIARLDLDRPPAGAPEANDATVCAVAEALRAPRREYDVVARLSDGSFAILLPRAGDEAARRVMKRVVRGFRDAPARGEGALRVTLSAGVAVWTPPSADAAEDLLRRAATALEAARARGPSSLAVDAGAGDWKEAIADELSEG